MPSIDERFEVIAKSLELMIAEQQEQRRIQEELDERERQARRALLLAMQIYLGALDGYDSDGTPGGGD